MTREIGLLAFLAGLPATLAAHVVSMSVGEARIDGNRLEYWLRMPLYEIEHVKDPGRSLLAQLHFRSAGVEARMVRSACRADAGDGAYHCSALYEFPEPVELLDIESTLPAVTVPNHVHLVRAARGDKTDQAVLDFTFPRAVIRFEPPTAWETALGQIVAGMIRALGGAAQVLFLAGLVLAARSRRELLALTAAFLAGEIAACAAVLRAGWQPAPRFVEAAAALTIAYLAVEILLLPQAGKRWLVLAALGAFHGLYFALLIREGEFTAAYVLGGTALAEAACIAFFSILCTRLGKVLAPLRPVQFLASLLFIVGMVWFFLRLRS